MYSQLYIDGTSSYLDYSPINTDKIYILSLTHRHILLDKVKLVKYSVAMDDGRMYNGELRLAAAIGGGMDHLGRKDAAQEPTAAEILLEELHDRHKDIEELLDALQGIHNRNERYGRSVRNKLLLKHGRIKEE